MTKIAGIIHNSVVDGQGLRTAIFLSAAVLDALAAIILKLKILTMEQNTILTKLGKL